MLKRAFINLPVAASLLLLPTAGSGQQPIPLDRITLPPGFSIDIYAEGLVNPRSMALSPSGTLFVGTRMNPQEIAEGVPGAGVVYAIKDSDNDYRADEVISIDAGLNVPNGVAFRDGDLYVAEINRILRYSGIESRLDNPPNPVVLNDTFPTDWLHGWKFIGFGPDGKLYVPVGAPCNVCDGGRSPGTPRSREWIRTEPTKRCSPVGFGIRSGSIGIRKRTSCGLRVTGATGGG